MHDWRSSQLTDDYLEGVRGGIPLAKTQIEVIIRIIKSWLPDLHSFLDMGCGDGVLGRQLLKQWPESFGIFMDYSEPMITSAKQKCKTFEGRSMILLQDYSRKGWIDSINTRIPVDVVISGYSIHHQDDRVKYRIYHEVYEILKPGGIFLNLEHVASPNPKIEKLFDEMFVDSLYAYHLESGGKSSKQEIADKFYNREDQVLNKLTSVEKQVRWLREIGYVNTDCFFKLFELALFGGQKPER
jgi:SAM-dependent methyltransferase